MKPLEGIKVLDLTTGVGLCTVTMADYGAEVVKVEKPGVGDPIRGRLPMKDGVSLLHVRGDRGKKSITLDITTEEGKEVFKELVKQFDMVVENMPVGEMEALGLGYEELKRINPKLIMGTMTGFGENGPWRDIPQYDLLAQAKSGFLPFTGFPDEPPTVIGFPITIQYSSLFLCAALNTAYLYMLRTGEGQHVSTSLWESLFAVEEDKIMYFELNEPYGRTGNAHPDALVYDVIDCKDGYVAMAPSTEEQWTRFCHEFNKPEWIDDPAHGRPERRKINYFVKGGARDQIVELMKQYTMEEIDAKCAACNCPTAPVHSVARAMEDPQLQVRQMVLEMEDQRLGKIKTIGMTAKFHGDNETDNVLTSAPLLGQDNEHYYREVLNMSAERVEALRRKNII